MANGILVITETSADRFRKSTYEAVSEGRRLADQLTTSLSAVVLGSGVLASAAELTQYGADRVLVCDAVELADFDSDRFTQILFDLVTSRPPKIILFGASIRDKQLGRELVDAKASWPMNQYIHAHVDKGYQGVGDTRAGTVDGDGIRYVPDQIGGSRAISGPVGVALETEARLTGGPAPATIRRRVVLYRGLRFVEFQNFVDKKAASS